MDLELEFISTDIIKQMPLKKKIDYILEKVEENKILVLDSPMTAPESSRLIEETMNKISDEFPGIEVSTLSDPNLEGWKEKLIKVLGGNPGGLTVIGPSKVVKKIKKDPRRITLMAGEEKKSE